MKIGHLCSCSGGDLDSGAHCQVHEGMHLCDFLLDLSSSMFEVLPGKLYETVEASMCACTPQPFKDTASLIRAAQLRLSIMQKIMPSVLKGLPMASRCNGSPDLL